jgi:hypothetical protein
MTAWASPWMNTCASPGSHVALWHPQATIKPQRKTFEEYADRWLVQRRTEG